MRGFGEFRRVAVIIIPDDEEYKRRAEQNKEKNTYIVSESTENEMKGRHFDLNDDFFLLLIITQNLHCPIANFTLPSPDVGWFDEVQFTELSGDEAKKKVEEFNEKGKKAVKEDREKDRGNRNDHRRGNFLLQHPSIYMRKWLILTELDKFFPFSR